jgi:hypothetical protein
MERSAQRRDINPLESMSEEGAEYRIRPPGMTPQYDLDIRAKLAHIDQMLADHDRKRQEIRLAPWQLFCVGMTIGAALFAGGALVKLLRL